MTQRELLIARAEVLWGGFYRCPTTGRIIEAVHGDDKALCGCRTSNPRVPTERAEQTSCHIVRFMDRATPAEYVDERWPEEKEG